jgi:hypothetical protein
MDPNTTTTIPKRIIAFDSKGAAATEAKPRRGRCASGISLQ